MTRFLILDRVEEGVAVFTDSEGRVYQCSFLLLPESSRENSAFTAETDGDRIVSLTPTENPDAGRNNARLKALLNKSKNK